MSALREARVVINGTTLDTGQAMTLRVALTSFVHEMQTEGLGDDEHGRRMAAGYANRGTEILKIMGLQ